MVINLASFFRLVSFQLYFLKKYHRGSNKLYKICLMIFRFNFMANIFLKHPKPSCLIRRVQDRNMKIRGMVRGIGGIKND